MFRAVWMLLRSVFETVTVPRLYTENVLTQYVIHEAFPENKGSG